MRTDIGIEYPQWRSLSWFLNGGNDPDYFTEARDNRRVDLVKYALCAELTIRTIRTENDAEEKTAEEDPCPGL